jgi:internalin A
VEGSVLPPNPFPGTQVVTAIDGSQYKKGYYFGRPSDHSSLTPTSMPFSSVNDNIYSHAYLNVYASGSISFSKVEFIGGGFELDNVAVSNQLRTPTSELVLLQSVLGKSVEFRANAGTGTMPAQTSDAATQLTSNAFIRPGYTFNGWRTTSSATGGTPFSDQASFDFANDMVLHAQWTANTLAVTYDTQGGSTINTGTTKTDEAISTDPGTPTRDGHTFNGWFSNSTGGNPLTFPHTHGKIAAFTIYAQWTPLTAPTSTSTSSTSTTSTTVAPTTTTTSTTVAPTTTTTSTTVAPTTTINTSTTDTPSTTLAAPSKMGKMKRDGVTKADRLPATGQQMNGIIALALACILMGTASLALRRTKN